MCGIFGGVVPRESSKKLFSRMQTAKSSLSHRGPDDWGIDSISSDQERTQVFIGHTRLSIIDLSSAGKQPFESQDGRFRIVFNGEIYNYLELRTELKSSGVVFRTETDTEVLLESWIKWGEKSLERLDGMFAFVMVDMQRSKLWACRDPFGIKPLFYQKSMNSFYFASEIEALRNLTDANHVDIDTVSRFVVGGHYSDGESSFVRGVRVLPPGCLLELDMLKPGAPARVLQWSEFDTSHSFQGTKDEAAEILRDIFIQSVSRQLRSDVPVGIALSGGIDSSSILSVARRLDPERTISSFSFISNHTANNEEHWIDIMNNEVGAVAHKVQISGEELSKDLEPLILAQGEPFRSTSEYAQFKVFEEVKNAGIKVTLDGQGADEIFAGYDGYAEKRAISLLRQGSLLETLNLIQNWHKWPGRRAESLIPQILSQMLPTTGTRLLRRLARKVVGQQSKASGLLVSPPFEHSTFFQGEKGRFLVESLSRSLGKDSGGLTDLLRHGDRNSMRWSIESRVPFLSMPLVSHAFSLPEDFLLSKEGETKSVFRLAMRGIVPDVILDRRDKIGFEAQPVVMDVFKHKPNIESIRRLGDLSLFQSKSIDNLVKDYFEGDNSSEDLLWRLLNLGKWIEINNLKI